mmetsp:Transcript_59198/g.173749  ORF Transcript_59198/g.173749 Transcript_59198/m.173749 type:complete len:204 (+) Transcript_59198:625-1236(+)
MWYLSDIFVSPVESAPNFEMPPASFVICSSSAEANSSSEHGSYLKTRALASTTRMKPPSSGFGMNSTSWKTFASASQLLERRCWMPEAKPSMMRGSTSPMRPKSRKASRPSSVTSMLPSCGSACTKPVKISEDTQASTAMSTMRTRSTGSVICARDLPLIHSIVSTRVVPLGPEYSGTQCGAVTNGRKRCFFRKSSAFAASLW